MFKFNIILYLSFFLTMFSCKKNVQKDLSRYVDPMIGSDYNGHTFPGATLPNGMVQLSPDTKRYTWNNCSGYHYSDKSILGFSHTHYSGTGAGGGGDILFMPTVGKINLSSGGNGSGNTQNGYASLFLHKNEEVSPGYYKVLLDDYNVKVELTSTLRTGFHRYTFPKTDKANVIIDLVSGIMDSPDSLLLNVDGRKLTGYRAASGGLDGSNVIFFAAEFSRPFNKYGIALNNKIVAGASSIKGRNVKAYFSFDARENKSVLLKVGISTVSIEGAKKNLKTELRGWDFDKVRKAAREIWNSELKKIIIDGGTKQQKTIFYTALYHTLIHPNIYMDTDKKYRSVNKKIYTAKEFDNYTTFSLWDTFRALHPLQTIINPDKTNHYIKTFIARYKHIGRMPIMEFSNNESATMIGYHSLPVIADAYVKGIRGYDVKMAYEGMRSLADGPRNGKRLYLDYGFIPYPLRDQPVSKTLEYSYDDWCVTRLAKDIGPKDYDRYNLRGHLYRNLFDKETKFMRAKDIYYRWMTPFDPEEVSKKAYTEANAYQYTPSVFQNLNDLVKLMGGDKAMERWLDNMFNDQMDMSKSEDVDVSGLIGQYAQGNEPSQHIAYLYNYGGAPWKTQQRVRQIMSELYHAGPAGLCGNDDAGQTSAWYVFSAMGFYPVTPGMDYYVVGFPLFDAVSINLDNGRQFKLIAKNNNAKNIYIQRVTKNGKPYHKTYIRHSDIVDGAEFVFEMGATPNPQWGGGIEDRPYSDSYDPAPTPEAYATSNVFLDQTTVKLKCPDDNGIIHYTLDGRIPDGNSSEYIKPFKVYKSATLKARCFAAGKKPGYPVTLHLEKVGLTEAVKVKSVKPGLRYIYKETSGAKIADFKNRDATEKGIIKTFNVDAIKDDRPFFYSFSGYVNVPADGLYEFGLKSNDGAILYIDGKELINSDGDHLALMVHAKTGLKKGFHEIKVDYFQMGGGKDLKVTWQGPGVKNREIPANLLFH